MGKKIEGAIARQLRVAKSFFGEMMDCTKSRDDYYQELRRVQNEQG
ncbi:MAG: hypothetical protein ACYC35_17180 [Pirellulales bacterium]